MGIFFLTQPEGAAAASVADHIKSCCNPVMRREAYAHMCAGGEGLEPLARAGLEALMARDPVAHDGVTK